MDKNEFKKNLKIPENDKSNSKIEKIEDEINKKVRGIEEKDDEVINELDDFLKSITRYTDNHRPLKSKNYIEMITVNTLNSKNKENKKRTVINNKKKQDAMKLVENENWDNIFRLEYERIDRYTDFEILYSYIPELKACIDGFVDSIISPDDLTGGDISISYNEKKLGEELDNALETKVINHLNSLKEKYKLNVFQRDLIRKTLITGDQFVGVLSYNNELENLLLREQNLEYIPPHMREKTNLLESTVLNESFLSDNDIDVLNEAITSMPNYKNLPKEKINNYSKEIEKTVSNIINNIEIKGAEALYSDTKKDMDRMNSNKKTLNKLKFNGSILKYFDPKYMIKLEIDGINFGYIYAQYKEKEMVNGKEIHSAFTKDFFNARSGVESINSIKAREEILTDIFVKGLGKKLDLKFVEKNKEFKEFVYVLLKNKEFFTNKVEFIYFDDNDLVHSLVDKDGIYGKSRLANSLFFGKLYLANIMNEQMQKMTRGRDKRVIYAEVGLEEAIEEAIQQVIRDIKSKEFNQNNFKSITTVLKQVGLFEDYVIPLIDGDKNIEFDTIQGIEYTFVPSKSDLRLKISLIAGNS